MRKSFRPPKSLLPKDEQRDQIEKQLPHQRYLNIYNARRTGGRVDAPLLRYFRATMMKGPDEAIIKKEHVGIYVDP